MIKQLDQLCRSIKEVKLKKLVKKPIKVVLQKILVIIESCLFSIRSSEKVMCAYVLCPYSKLYVCMAGIDELKEQLCISSQVKYTKCVI